MDGEIESVMFSPSKSIEVEEAIKLLEEKLNYGYLAAEKLMSLRRTDTAELNNVLQRVDQLYVELLSALTDAELDTGVAAAAALKNKIEFDKRINDWRAKGNQQSGSSNLATTSESYLQSKVETA